MKEIPLTRGAAALVDDEMHDRLVARGRWHCTPEGYASRRKDCIRMQHDIFHLLGIPAEVIDFRDRNRLNCQLWNLRPATKQQDSFNRSRYSNNTSGYIGVSAHNRGWMAYITHNNKSQHIGMFDTPIAAARARDAVAIELFGEFAGLNFPLPIVPEPFDVALQRLRPACAA